MIDTLKLRIHGINDIKRDLGSEIKVTNGYGTLFAVPEHNDLYKALLKYKGKYFYASTVVSQEKYEKSERDTDDFLTMENSRLVHEHLQTRNVMRFVDEDKVKEVNMSINGSYRVPSSFNGVTFRINESAGFIDFEFSVPKYLYGHSLAEFIPQINSELYERNFFQAFSWGFQQKHLFERLNKFIDIFISDICNHFKLELLLNKRYIEIVRLDLCFNQFFDNKNDALRYLEHLRKINHKRHRENQKAPEQYDTSIAYMQSNGCYFKIYHKGTEYSFSQHGDMKKHISENEKFMDKILKRMLKKAYAKSDEKLVTALKKIRNGGKFKDSKEEAKAYRAEMIKIMQEMAKGTFSRDNYDEATIRFAKKLYKIMPYKVDFFKKEMDKVLRYEVSLRSAWFTYYYKNKLFRRKDEIHNNAYYKYRLTKNAMHRRSAKSTPTGLELRNYKAMNNYLSRTVHLMVETGTLLKRFEKYANIDFNSAKQHYKISSFGLKHTILHDKDIGTFNNDILKGAVFHFKKLVDEYQVMEITPDDDLERRITAYNLQVEQNVKQYNEKNHYKIYNDNGKQRTRGRLLVTEPVQLLTQKEKVELDLKKVRPLVLVSISRKMKEGKSLREIRKDLNVSASQWSRYKRDLHKFGIEDRTRVEPNPIVTYRDWSKVYTLLGELPYYDSFYIKRGHSYNL